MTHARMARCVTAALALVAAATAAAQEKKPPGSVIACENLVTLRRLMAQAPDQGSAKQHLQEHPGCHEFARTGIGEVERRAMIGGAPFECLRLDAGSCKWVLP